MGGFDALERVGCVPVQSQFGEVRQHSPHQFPQVLEGEGTMIKEDEQNQDSDVEKDLDGGRPLREISKRSTVMKDHAMSMNSEASAYTQNSLSSVAPLSSPAIKGSWRRASEFNPTTIATPTHLLGVFIRFVVIWCGQRVCIPCFVETVIDGVHTRRARRDCRYWRCIACTSSMITSNFASGMQLKIEGGVVSEGGNPDVQDELEDKELGYDLRFVRTR